MLQALKRLHAIDPDDGDFHRILVDFVLTGQLQFLWPIRECVVKAKFRNVTKDKTKQFGPECTWLFVFASLPLPFYPSLSSYPFPAFSLLSIVL